MPDYTGLSTRNLTGLDRISGVFERGLAPARLLAFSLDGCGGVLGGQFCITWAVLLRLGAYLQQLRARLGDIESPVERRHASCEVGAAGTASPRGKD